MEVAWGEGEGAEGEGGNSYEKHPNSLLENYFYYYNIFIVIIIIIIQCGCKSRSGLQLVKIVQTFTP